MVLRVLMLHVVYLLFYHPPTKLRKGNVFSRVMCVCLFTKGGSYVTTTHEDIVQSQVTWGSPAAHMTSINEGTLIDCDFKCHSILGMTIDIYNDISKWHLK